MIKQNWTTQEILDIYNLPFFDLIYRAAEVHRQHHDPNKIQVSSLISVKTGGCPEDCGYCPQAARYHTEVKIHEMLPVNQVKAQALRAKQNGISRVCLGAAWRNVKDGPDFDHVLDMVREVTKLDMEVCCTLGMLTENQAKRLEEAGLYAYNHNIDSSEEYYKEVISTRAFEDRLETINNVRKTSITLCSGGIIGMGESVEDRCGMLKVLANMMPQPESVPINALVAVEGTPMEDQEPVNIFEFVRMVATARIVLPKTQVRLSAGRTEFSKEGQALCFFAGANSIFAGDKLLTTPNPDINEDKTLFNLLGIKPQQPFEKHAKREVVDKENSQYRALGENPKWTRPGHKIPRNEEKRQSSSSLKDNE
ncbi:biotin synthase BioB [Riemerella anatipestifer]|uniref:Biotin synthase n=1 Tax=Riemerella anatipestifer (strain ATCC 11845 / DSM 15868 / JCM 9532 / NCTC 11014) TaxID=693978 RepID=E4TCG9_RIEAD|nr:biotin synthase BioB [Riemerella anatipestifer]ADQ82478.1 biotin synthase [Riemerella anatipestifer ATCC 11845 = DSM 15868]ADZ12027.1 Biotin synthase related enzyme [Riemerella anatipestifer RA-GD]AFD56484.1 biotin synthase [Riemerella anatipestifer ATCC 11845 = DSM 15868]AGC39586.1 Biotin synthase-related enzyme [Riemerella anatipestifer RA-CH-2]AKP69674.1 biotin synthase [Riemerella anatipestifer]